MTKEIVKYHNDLNTVVMRGRTSEEMNFFFAIIAKIRDKGTETVEFNTNELKELTRFADAHKQRWEDTMLSAANKIIKLNYVERTTQKISIMVLFSRFDVYPETKKITVEITKNFEYIVNQLTGHFTTYELAEFTQIKSTYAKTMYRILKQWRTVGEKKFSIEKLRMILEVPESYTNGMVNKRIIKKIEKELSALFVNFKVKVIKANTQGNPITGYKFTWVPEKVNSWDPNRFKNNATKTNKKQTYKKKRYRSKNGSIEAKKFAERAREQRFARMIEQRKEEQGQTGKEILEEMQNLNNKEQENEI